MSLRQLAYSVISFEPVLQSIRRAKLKGKVVVLIYHEVMRDADEIASWTVIRASDFKRQMDYLKRNFDIMSLKNALAFATGADDGQSKSHRPKLVITFDDGWAGNLNVMLPIIKEKKIPVTVFVATSGIRDNISYWDNTLINAFQGKTSVTLDLGCVSLGKYAVDSDGGQRWEQIYKLLLDLKKLKPEIRDTAIESIMSHLDSGEEAPCKIEPMMVDELRELAASPLVTIGAHSHCHSMMTQLDDAELKQSIDTSRQLLELWTGKEVRYFAYPHGNYDKRVIKALKEGGFECAFTTFPTVWERQSALFGIPRIGVGRFDNFSCFKIKASGWFRNMVPGFIRPGR